MAKQIGLLLLLVCIAGMAHGETSATVTESVNDVSHGGITSGKTSPAPSGTKVPVGEFLKTGTKSRAELELANSTVTRLGANTIFNYSPEKNEIDLQAGTVLFSKPKDGKQMNIRTAAVTAAVVGTTGFVQEKGKDFVFGLVEGKVTLTIGGKGYTITAGELLKFVPGQPPQIFAFNVPLFLKTSPLLTKFKHKLPTQAAIDKEVADYNDLVSRGFITPPTQPFFLVDQNGSVSTVPITANNSAGSSLHQFNNPPPPPPPPPPSRGD